MNHCKTKGGLRLLRLNLCQPPTFEVSIQKRLDSVSELISTPELIILLQSILTHIGDLDQLLSLTCIDIKETESFYLLEQRLNNVIALKQILHFLPSLRNALEPCSSDLLVETSQFLKDGRFEELESKIKLVVSDEARMKKSSSSMKLHRCFAIKSGLNIYLDLARNMYNDFVEELESITRILSQDHELNIKLEFTMNRGYHCSLVSRNKPFGTLPPHFLHQQIQKNKNSYTIRFTTEEIITLDRKSQNSLRECILMSNSMITELLLELRSSIGILYKFSEQLSRLDMLISFAVTSCNAGYSRPSFSATLALQNSRHPILDFMASSTTEGNNVYADEQSNFHVIMGSNMAGKSTLLRQILLLQIMAQNGCYVPCDYGSFRIVEAIFSRIGTGDSIECNASTFTLEMKEMAYIMNYITPESKTLIFVDELGRGTSNREGESLCWAIAEQLLQYSKSYTFLATHFPLLKRLDCLYPNVLSHYFLTEGQKYKCVRGHFMERDYGIQWSKKTSLPSSIIETANELAQKIREKEQMSNSNDKETCFNNNNMELFKRIQLIVKKAPKEEIGEYLKELRRSCRQEEE